MNITIIGSSQYLARFLDLKRKLLNEGHKVKIPVFDDHPRFNELGVCTYNLEAIKWADKVIMIWDNRSIGTIFDFGMVFALQKPFKIEYIEPKTFAGVMRKYAAKRKRQK
jgi:nucleoside 2-deoxyribosyltransferase